MVYKAVKDALLGYFIWTSIHWTVTNVYSKTCTPFSYTGFISTFFMTQTFYCDTLHWLSCFSHNTMGNALATTTSFLMIRLCNSYNYAKK